LPADFAAGAAGKPVTVIRSVVKAEESSEDLDPALRQLMKYGYQKDESLVALESNRGDDQRASVDLFLSLCRKLGHQNAWGSVTIDSYLSDGPIASDTLDEELMALEAIFGDMVRFNDNRSVIYLSFNALVDDGIVSTLRGFGIDIDQDVATTDGIEMKSKFIFPAGDLYPNTPPVCMFTSSFLPAECMRTVTEMVIQRISEFLGQALVYEVVSFIMENIGSCIQKFLESSRDLKGTLEVDQAALVDNVGKPHVASKPTKARPKASRSTTLTQSEVISENQRLKSWQIKLDTSAECEKMLKQRQSLPAATKRFDVMQAVNQNRVTIIMGSTGCGKSTQIPQYILEDAIAIDQGGRCNIICTQPRRISAIGLATRVSQERHESVGCTIGYSVRLDSKQSKNTRLLFCTTGVMLRRLLADPELKTVTHVVLDEVHERTIESDLLLFLLRELITTGKNKEIKIILMSATAEAQLFAGYFENNKTLPPVISIPGFTHPVQDFFLEDAIEATGYQIGKSSKWAKKRSAKDEDKIIDLGPNYSESTEKTMSIIDESAINVDLIEALVLSILLNSRQRSDQKNSLGAILIFVPGAMLINKLVKGLQTSHAICSHDFNVKALPLHGGLPPAEQSKVFARPPAGVTKIVVATNVAETSITIDDVTCVIDTGKANEVRFDATRGISRLQEVFVSQASCQQRRGRAGRVQPGVCYKLFSKRTWESLDRNTLPEISRSALHSLVMDTKSITSGDIYDTLQRMLTPPPMDGLHRAVTSLERMGVLDAETQHLTPLGQHLVQMPCDPKLGKMLIYSAILRCVDPVLTIAAAQAFGKPVFWSSPDSREEAAAAKSKLVGSTHSSKSDHIAVIAAYNGWRRVLAASGRRSASSYCSEYFISDQAMDSIHSGRRQYAEILSSLGFIPDSYPNIACRAEYTSPSLTQKDDEPSIFSSRGQVDEYSGHARVVKAALASGFYPQLLRVQNPAAQFQKIHGGAIETEGSGAKVKIFDREKGRVFIHPSSINFTVGKFESGWLVFSDMMETSKIFIRECSMVPVYAVLLFGGNISVQHEKGMLVVDDWASFKSPARIGVLVRELRIELARLLGKKIEDPGLEISKSKLIDAMHHLLSTDGF
jgi:ATP-dependent RNA helicase DHX57